MNDHALRALFGNRIRAIMNAANPRIIDEIVGELRQAINGPESLEAFRMFVLEICDQVDIAMDHGDLSSGPVLVILSTLGASIGHGTDIEFVTTSLAVIYFCAIEDWQGALLYHRRVAELSESIEVPQILLARVFSGLGLCYRQTDRPRDALDCYLKALRIAEKEVPESAAEAMSCFHVGLLFEKLGYPEDALLTLTNAARIFAREAPNCDPYPTTLASIGLLQHRKGEYDQAISSYMRALDLAERLYPNSPFTASVLEQLGETLYRKGDYIGSVRVLLQLVALREQEGRKTLSMAQSYEFIALSYQHTRQFDKAIEANKKTLAIACELAPDSNVHAGSLMNLGNCSLLCGEIGLAQRYFSQALQIYKKLDSASPLTGWAHHSLGLSYLQVQDSQQAIEHLTEAFLIRKAHDPASPDLVETSTKLAEEYERIDDLPHAIEFRAEAIKSLFLQDQANA